MRKNARLRSQFGLFFLIGVWFLSQACGAPLTNPPESLSLCSPEEKKDCPEGAKCIGGVCIQQSVTTETTKTETVTTETTKTEPTSDASEQQEAPEEPTQEKIGEKTTPDIPSQACQTGSERSCYTANQKTKDIGACKAGIQTCDQSGKWGACIGEIKPKPKELCNGKDDNCNGKTDEKLTQSCYSGDQKTKNIGICKAGTQACKSGKWGACIGEIKPKPKEICNNKDDDCDGTIDEGCPCSDGDTQNCGSDKGECKAGTQTCDKSGKWGTCIGQVIPTKEVCNGKDDDCDGQTDENLTQSCKTLCGSGSKICKSGVWQACNAPKPQKEVCNGKDDDCDGAIDEGCPCTGDTPQNCTIPSPALGCLKQGTQVCNNKKWSPCFSKNQKRVSCTQSCSQSPICFDGHKVCPQRCSKGKKAFCIESNGIFYALNLHDRKWLLIQCKARKTCKIAKAKDKDKAKCD